MGLFDWFKRSPSSDLAVSGIKSSRKEGKKPGPKLKLRTSVTYSPLMPVAGTTSNSKEAAVALVQRHQLEERVALYITGSLQREPENAYDPDAVAVLVEGERIGYLPGYAAKDLTLAVGSSVKVPLQLFCANLGTRVRVEAFVWLSEDDPQWQHSTDNPPAMSPAQKRMAAQGARTTMVREALAQGGTRADEFKAGMVQGVHYLELVEPIKQLKREGKLEEALILCYAAIEGAENGRLGREPAPSYTEHAAIIHRKLGQKDQEIAVLKRWLKFIPVKERQNTSIGQRLDKITG